MGKNIDGTFYALLHILKINNQKRDNFCKKTEKKRLVTLLNLIYEIFKKLNAQVIKIWFIFFNMYLIYAIWVTQKGWNEIYSLWRIIRGKKDYLMFIM